MRTAHLFAIAVVVSAAMLGAPNAFAEKASTDLAAQVNQANALLREGKLKEAIDGYQRARSIAPEEPSVSYNAGIAQYRKGDIAAAERLFQSAAVSDDDAVAHRARFNLGNCSYASALQVAEKDRANAIKELEKAIANYREALDIDSSDANARANIELASKLIEKLREADKKDQQNQSQQQDQKQQRDQKNEQQSQQQQQSKNQADEQSQKGKEQKEHQQRQQNESQQSQESQAGKNEQAHADKSKSEQKKQSTSEGQQQAARQKTAPSESANQVNKQNPTPRHEQRARADEKKEDKSSNQESAEQQGKSPPKGTLSASGRPKEQASKETSHADVFDPARDGEMTRQEAEKMLQAIRDREMIRRLQRQSAERSRHVPVDRDW